MPKRIIGPKRDEIIGDWRKLNNEELHNLYSSPNIIRIIKSRRMRCAGHVARMGRRGVQSFVGKARRKEGDMTRIFSGRVILRRILGWGGMDWINLAQDRDQWQALLNRVMNHWVP
jgi:hypothetical protein